MGDTLADRLGACYSGAVHDVLRAMGRERIVLPSTIRPLDPTLKLAGEIWTVSGHIDRSRSPHETLLAWVTLLSKAPPGKVIVCQPNNSEVALMGELSAETLKYKGVRGYVVDGGCRDSDFILSIGFPVFHRFFTPSDIVGRWVPDRFGEPVIIGDVSIATGDYLIGDRDGVVVVPAELAVDAVARTEEVVRTESQVRRAIMAGIDPVDAYMKFGKF
ncbi:MAG TPA: RraA family protein [Alphaproteobacteria bacterium]|nr:RraA family protein [Alphaproteobacteria bacterium]